MQPNIPPPPGYVPGQTRVPLILGFTYSVTVLTLALASMRFYVRHHMLHSVGLDDWFLLGAILVLTTIAAMSTWAVTKGYGRHAYDLIMAGGNPEKDLFVVCSSLDFPPTLPLSSVLESHCADPAVGDPLLGAPRTMYICRVYSTALLIITTGGVVLIQLVEN